MDDIVTGCENIENAKILKNQLIKMFKTCGMTLHKWNFNNSELLDIEYPISEKHLFAQLEECTTKTLGMVWNSKSDTLTYNSERIILLGYCDASIAAYGAVVYLRSYCENYTPTTKLLASKITSYPFKDDFYSSTRIVFLSFAFTVNQQSCDFFETEH
ncbi:uncharacterized protein TNIN_125181 [Trichonephila inaurata madagascariensis]|uniref:Uncharacterized protein n=1 Tax=Trichonephila inaurata madagascariensis TaxID=2747483 RepID=A0A8X7CUP3_9ARAC|nr:uncharacterized protein TNIN_125181 [Trichonephila inaurata madagascariensis]